MSALQPPPDHDLHDFFARPSGASSSAASPSSPTASTSYAGLYPGATPSSSGHHGEPRATPPSSSSRNGFGGCSSKSSTSPILPRTKLPFPSSSPKHERGIDSSRSPPVSPTRAWAQTTTTTRKTERRSWRYSLPDFDDAFDYDFDAVERSASPAPRSTRSTSRIHSPSSARASSKSTTRITPSARKRSTSTSSATLSAVSPSRPRPATSSFHAGPLFPERPFNFSRALSPRPASPSDHPVEPVQPGHALTRTTNHLFKPVVSLFVFMLVSTIACLSVSAVLLASFSLTFYDDCGRRIIDFHRGLGDGRRRFQGSIEGVKVGVERMMGGARGAVDLAVWVAGARKPDLAAPTTEPTGSEDSSGDEQPQFRRAKSSMHRPAMTRGLSATARRRRTTSTGSSKGRDSTPRRSRESDTHGMREDDGSDERWTDDENPPYHEPHPTPHASRPGSPHRAPRASALPPRPRLSILIPSILVACLITLVRLVMSRWSKSRERAQR